MRIGKFTEMRGGSLSFEFFRPRDEVGEEQLLGHISEKANTRIPIIPGIMPITDISRIEEFGQRCGAALQAHIIQCLEKEGSTTEEARKVGIEVATEQCADLLQHGIRYFHFYTLNQSDVVFRIVSDLGLQNLGKKRLKSSAKGSVR